MARVKQGAKAPNFSLHNQNGDLVSLKDFVGKYLILYFYPKALTPGCTAQACGMRDIQKELQSLNAAAVGISPDPVKKLQKFKEKHELNFDLLADEDHSVAESYGVWELKKFMGKEYMGVVRTTFVIDPTGKIVGIPERFTTSTHHQVVLDWLKSHIK
ncbi:thioredoxin-dependent thiol peroxidase [Saccharophagus sp. K07]|jgi:peroxiredoxin Q/BCP|uniref:thioredoxin-dependent thiol peroxidase n=1 Tax=Saccharophagus sp. K07 TaxID=2283636 RepID=UPI0016523CF0|nr:thioredoxin-dependent thiol peroxidase [Saccharophagus sp. K07]MBC6904887.1 thioredoxin-dependent thiol peroxidase [Saccharophagus sp. K07]